MLLRGVKSSEWVFKLLFQRSIPIFKTLLSERTVRIHIFFLTKCRSQPSSSSAALHSRSSSAAASEAPRQPDANDDHAYYRRELRERMLELSRYRSTMRRMGAYGAGGAGGGGGFDPPGSTAGTSAFVDQQERSGRYCTVHYSISFTTNYKYTYFLLIN